MSTTVTAATVRREFLHRGMDARALNLDQYNPSPAIDSLLEWIKALALALPPSVQRGRLLAALEQAIESNLREGSHLCLINGAADSLVRDLRDGELNGDHSYPPHDPPFGAKAIARRLRAPLASLSAGADAIALLEISRVLRAIPRVQLLAPAVAHELGALKFAVLEDLLAQVNGAAQLGTAGAEADRERDGQRGQV